MWIHVTWPCVTIRSQARQQPNVDLMDIVLMPAFSGDAVVKNVDEVMVVPLADAATEPRSTISPEPLAVRPRLPVSREGLQAAQEADPTLHRCYATVVSSIKASGDHVHYFIKNGTLMRRWVPRTAPDDELNSINQIVVPTVCRPHILSVAQESQWSGHLGITKT